MFLACNIKPSKFRTLTSISKCMIRGLSDNANFRPTIYALSTKFARSAIGVVRISGPQSSYIYGKLTNSKREPIDRIASVRRLYSPETKVLLDESLALFFKGPKSYTGEDILELHLHGGTAIIQSVLKEIRNLHNPERGIIIRHAENGEFSQRAFVNGRFDLTEIEGIREMIDAETETQRVAALSSLTGNNKKLFSLWREEILHNVALLTTLIDFGEDHDIEEVAELFTTVEEKINDLSSEIRNYLQKVQSSEVLLNGIKLTLIGPPNAGKSSILNYLANKEAAIVSSIAGTTRDIIDVPLEINGYKIVVGDTAGIRSVSVASDVIEKEGIRRAKEKSLTGDLVLAVLPVCEEVNYDELQSHLNTLKAQNREVLVILNKEDLLAKEKPRSDILKEFSGKLDLDSSKIFLVSCTSGTGMNDLVSGLTQSFKHISETETSDPIIVSSRVQDLLKNDVLYGFEQFKYWKDQDDVVLATESLKQSVEGIGKITGEAIGLEEVLGVVFSSFCIGK